LCYFYNSTAAGFSGGLSSYTAMIERIFLGWNKPFLQSVGSYLISRTSAAADCDLRSILVVTPSGRAGRRLIEILVGLADGFSKILVPPRIVTLGGLSDLFCGEDKTRAGIMERRLALAHACRSVDKDLFVNLFPYPPQDAALAQWILLARELEKVFYELAASGKEIKDVIREAAEFSGSDLEEGRWRVIGEVFSVYERLMDDAGLLDPTLLLQKGISSAAAKLQYKEILLLGCADLNEAQRHLLLCADLPTKSLIFAPQEQQERFDEIGCVIPQAWNGYSIPLKDDCIAIVSAPIDQARHVRNELAALASKYAAADITIGISDESVLCLMREVLAATGVSLHEPSGDSAATGSPARLLSMLASFAESRRFTDFAMLVRHPDVETYLVRVGVPANYLIILDSWQKEHLQGQMNGFLPGEHEHDRIVSLLYGKILNLMGALGREQRLLGEWPPEIRRLLVEVYVDSDGRQPVNREVFELLGNVLARMEAFNFSKSEQLSGASVIKLAVHELEEKILTPPVQEGALEVLGWLELALDDAPVLLVTGCNEGSVPEVINSDPFLPNALRSRLGLTDNDRRHARDAFFLTAICSSREVLKVIAGKMNADGDPLMPSKLLFMCNDDELADRVRKFSGCENEAEQYRCAIIDAAEPALAHLPKPVKLSSPLEKVSVTSLRDYLACPYRFYLRHVLGLKSLDDGAREMDALVFGTLAHEVLQSFAASEAAQSCDAEVIKITLQNLLHQAAVAAFGAHAYPAVLVQLRQLVERLNAFAKWQASWVADGWRIIESEHAFSGKGVTISVEGRKVALSGRIDRIDHNRLTGEVAVFDYKTGDKSHEPDQIHRRAGEWTDLQLPAYEYALRAMGEKRAIRLGYILLGSDLAKVGEARATWSAAELKDAKECLRETVGKIAREEFWPPSIDTRSKDDFAVLFSAQGAGSFDFEE
jgi:RecB family exonuclease